MASTYLFGPNDRRNVDDVRPAVYEVHRPADAATARASGSGARCTTRRRCRSRPSSTRRRAASACCSASATTSAFQDDEQRFERRPSLWIEPLGDWGQGSVQLLEIPSDSEVNDNILAYWRPEAPMAAGSEVALRLPAVLVLDAARAPAARRS